MPVVMEFTVSIDNRPGALAELAESLAAAQIRINSLQGLPCGGQGIFQLVTEDTPATHEVFQEAGIEYIVREVLVIQLESQPGALAKVARLLGDAGINIDSVYATLGGQVVLGVDSLERALPLVQPLGIL
jgi:hypothetical protein